jgi:propionyl-CoA carboxylase beta chain
VLASGVVPQISLIMGPCAGGAVYSPAMTDFIFMVKDSSYMFVTGPEVVKTVTHEDVTAEELGGAVTHTTKSGVADLAFENDVEALMMMRRLISFLPGTTARSRRVLPTQDPADRIDYSLDTLVPDNPNKPYDIKELIIKTVDDGDFFELQPRLRQEHRHRLRTHGRLDRRHRRQPAAGPGRLPRHQELDQGRALRALLRRLQHPGGDLRRRARLHARHRAGIRRHHQARRQAALRLRRVHGAEGHRDHPQGLRRRLRRDGSKHLRGDVNFAWPSAEIAVMGPKGAVEIIFREEKGDPAKLAAREAEYKAKFANPFVAGARGFIDDVIMPHETRKRICRSLAMLRDKKLENPWRKHGNIPL